MNRWVSAASALCALVIPLFADAAMIRGSVRSDKGPLLNAFVTVSDDRGRVIIARRAVPAGSISIRIDNAIPVVTCVVDADGFEPRRLTLDVRNGVADAGTITLPRTPGLTMNRPAFSVSGDGKDVRVDVIVTNDSSAKIRIREVSFEARQREAENCLDLLTPDVVIAVQAMTTVAKNEAVEITTSAGSETRSAEAQFSTGKCGRIDLRIDTGIIYETSKFESHRLRFVFPRQVTLPNQKAPRILDVETWPMTRITVTTEEGRQYTSQ